MRKKKRKGRKREWKGLGRVDKSGGESGQDFSICLQLVRIGSLSAWTCGS